MKIELVIPGEPRGKGRPRIVRLKNGRSGSYTPDKTVSYEELIRQRFRQQYPGEQAPFPAKTPVSVTIGAFFPIPRSAGKKQKLLMASNHIRPTKKPDVDNIAKIVLDALNGLVWHDDAQITHLSVVKRYVEECDRCPYVCVTVCGEGGETDGNRMDPLQ